MTSSQMTEVAVGSRLFGKPVGAGPAPPAALGTPQSEYGDVRWSVLQPQERYVIGIDGPPSFVQQHTFGFWPFWQAGKGQRHAAARAVAALVHHVGAGDQQIGAD